MKASLRHLLRQMLRLGSGEALARVCGIITLLFLARRFGVILVGVYALGQTMAQYSLPFIDFGLRHVGARLVAQYPQAARQIVQRVQRRRVVMAFALLPFLTVYAASTRLPWNLKACLLAFAATCTLHALSLDWLAWGRERLGLIGVSRGVIPLSILIFAVAGRNSANVLWWVVLGHVIGVLSTLLQTPGLGGGAKSSRQTNSSSCRRFTNHSPGSAQAFLDWRLCAPWHSTASTCSCSG